MGTPPHHPVKIGGHRYCVNGDIMLLVFEEEDSKVLASTAITVYFNVDPSASFC